MRAISRVLIVLGLLVTVCSNLATVYGLYKAVHGMANAEENGIAAVASGMHTAFVWSHGGLVGCLILIVGLILAALRPSARAAAASGASE